eukprot:Em0001g645a
MVQHFFNNVTMRELHGNRSIYQPGALRKRLSKSPHILQHVVLNTIGLSCATIEDLHRHDSSTTIELFHCMEDSLVAVFKGVIAADGGLVHAGDFVELLCSETKYALFLTSCQLKTGESFCVPQGCDEFVVNSEPVLNDDIVAVQVSEAALKSFPHHPGSPAPSQGPVHTVVKSSPPPSDQGEGHMKSRPPPPPSPWNSCCTKDESDSFFSSVPSQAILIYLVQLFPPIYARDTSPFLVPSHNEHMLNSLQKDILKSMASFFTKEDVFDHEDGGPQTLFGKKTELVDTNRRVELLGEGSATPLFPLVIAELLRYGHLATTPPEMVGVYQGMPRPPIMAVNYVPFSVSATGLVWCCTAVVWREGLCPYLPA